MVQKHIKKSALPGEKQLHQVSATDATVAGTKAGADNAPLSFHLTRPVFFIGFMGAGKTSVARRVARLCHITSVDMDTYIERREGEPVPSIFSARGEDGFRALESAVLKELATIEPLLVSCGGGIVLKPENRELLKDKGFVIYLKVSADEAANRISDVSTRPLFKDIDTARATNEARMPLYSAVADASIDTTGKSISRIAREVKDILQKEGVLWQTPR